MQWWNDFQTWLATSEGSQAVFVGCVSFVALVVGVLVASWLTRASIRRILSRQDRERKNSAIATLVDCVTEASVWNSLTPQEQVLSDRAVGLADLHVRMLPIKGAAVAANWAAHQLADMKRNSATFGYQLGPAIAEFRDRLVDWSMRPAKAKRNFESDLEGWQRAANDAERRLLAEQEAWVAQQENDALPSAPATAFAPAPAFTPRERERQERESSPAIPVTFGRLVPQVHSLQEQASPGYSKLEPGWQFPAEAASKQ